jgi:predicted anti-sigma-YlaC factor YlaD
VTKLSCQEVLDQLADYLDEDARAELVAQFKTHLNGCSDCTAEVDSIRKTIELFHCHETVGVTIQMSDGLRSAMEAAYRGGSEPPRAD